MLRVNLTVGPAAITDPATPDETTLLSVSMMLRKVPQRISFNTVPIPDRSTVLDAAQAAAEELGMQVLTMAYATSIESDASPLVAEATIGIATTAEWAMAQPRERIRLISISPDGNTTFLAPEDVKDELIRFKVSSPDLPSTIALAVVSERASRMTSARSTSRLLWMGLGLGALALAIGAGTYLIFKTSVPQAK